MRLQEEGLEAADGNEEDWGQHSMPQPRQGAPLSSREATPLDSAAGAYTGSEAGADGDWQPYDDEDDDGGDDGDDDKDEDYQ